MKHGKKKKYEDGGLSWQERFRKGFNKSSDEEEKERSKKLKQKRESDYLESLGMEDGGVAKKNKKQALKNLACKRCKGNCNCK